MKHPTPPRFLTRVIETLLPPDQREQILGDLEERYLSRGAGMAAWWSYLRDAVSVVPPIVLRALRRTYGIAPERLAQASARGSLRMEDPESVLRWARNYQQGQHARNLLLFLYGPIVLALTLAPSWRSPDSLWAWTVIAGMIGLYVDAALRLQRARFARAVPSEASTAALLRFHREEIRRQLDGAWWFAWLVTLIPCLGVAVPVGNWIGRFLAGDIPRGAAATVVLAAAVVGVLFGAAVWFVRSKLSADIAQVDEILRQDRPAATGEV